MPPVANVFLFCSVRTPNILLPFCWQSPNINACRFFTDDQLLWRMKHAGALANLSDQLGKRARANSEALISV